MNPNMNMHPIGQQQIPNNMMQGGVSPMMQASPQPQPQQQQPGGIMGPGGPQQQLQTSQPVNPQQPQVHSHQQLVEKLDNVTKVKSLFVPLRESLFLTLRSAAYTLQHNNAADNLKRDAPLNTTRFDKHLEDFFSYCDQIELQLKTAMACMQQLSSAQHYLPGAVATVRLEHYVQDNAVGQMSYPGFLSTVRTHIQSAKDIHDTLISAAQNISQVD